MKSTSAKNKHHCKRESCLSPHELSQTKSTGAVTAQAEQSNEHNEKQNEVGNEGDDNVKLVALGIGWHAAVYDRIPFRAKLQMKSAHEVRIKTIPIHHLHVRYLNQCVHMRFLACRRARETSPCMRNATLTTHAPIEIAMTTMFLFQIAMLDFSISHSEIRTEGRADALAKHNQQRSSGKG
jgi:hypothetical protein